MENRTPESSGLFRPNEVATLCGVGVRTVERWVASGNVTSLKIGGRLHITRASLAAFVGEQAAKMLGIDSRREHEDHEDATL